MSNRKGLSLIELLVVIFILGLLVAILIPPIGSSKPIARRLVCGTNAKGLGISMYVYANDYDDKLPVQGAGTRQWGETTTGWDNPGNEWPGGEGSITVASSLYLLVREADVGFGAFVCLSSDETEYENKTGHDLTKLWDFGGDPSKHVSYAYHFPYGEFTVSATSNAGNAVLADRNPWYDDKLTRSSIDKAGKYTFKDKVSLIDNTDDSDWKKQIGNSQPHDREGQNVLYVDGHVEFLKSSDVGVDGDNIYTIGGETEKERRIGKAPAGRDIDAANETDSLLVND